MYNVGLNENKYEEYKKNNVGCMQHVAGDFFLC